MHFLIAVEDLDGILDGDDVLAQVAVDVVDHGRQGGGLAGAGGAGDQHHAPRLQSQLLHHRAAG